MRTLKIEVLPEDIQYGVKGSVHNCALALAVKRATQNPRDYVGCVGIEMEIGRIPLGRLIPHAGISLGEWVDRFDNDEPCYPFSAEFEVRS